MGGQTNEETIRKYAVLPSDKLQDDENGLKTEDVENFRIAHGSNRAEGIPKDTVAFRLRRAFINPFSVVLTVLAVISCLVDIVIAPETGRNYTTVIIICAMLMISGCVRFTQELRSKKIADRLIHLVDIPVSVKRDGRWQKIKMEELVVGDVVRLTAGERVPADIRLLKAKDCFLSESAISGESDTREKTAEALRSCPKAVRECKNIAFCGSTVVNGFLEGLVIAVGNKTLYGNLVPKSIHRKQGYNQGANAIAWVLIRFMILLVPITFIACGLTKGNWISSFLFSLSVAVGLTPELLPMVITACLAKGSFNMGRKQTIVKNVNAMQGFGNMDILCIDKTGTLTQDMLLLEYYMDILGNEDQTVLDSAYLNSFYHSGIDNHLDTAILKTQQMQGKKAYYADLTERYEKLDELPFDYTRKMASVLLAGKGKNVLLAKGSVQDILEHCRFAFYKGKKIPIDENGSNSVHAIVDEMLEDGMKVLAVAVKETDEHEIVPQDERNLTLIGYLGFFDTPKKTASVAIQKLHDLHVGTKVLTGDNRDVAISICKRLGMDTEKIMTGKELDALSDNDTQIRVEETLIFAELSPSQKAKIVEILQSNGHTVGFLADGMNDLPAILASDVGISVDTAVSSVKECSDVILMKKDLQVLESGITEGRRAFANMSKYVKITASSNLGNIIAVIIASIFLPFFPMTSVQILLLNLLYDILCLVLPWDRVDREMIQKPMEWSGKNLSRFMMVFGPVSSIFDILTFLFLFYFLCPTVCGGAYSTLPFEEQALFVSVFQTGWFLESMWTQILILHLLRTAKLPFVQSKPSSLFTGITLLGIGIFTVLAVTPIGKWMGMTSLPSVYYAFLIATVLCYLFLVTLVKKWYVKHNAVLI